MMSEPSRDCVAGLDPSLTGFGVCIWPETCETPELHRLVSRPGPKTVAGRMERLGGLLEQLFGLLDVWEPRIVVIENYAFNAIVGSEEVRIQAGHYDRIELGGVLRMDLWTRPYVDSVYEVAPASMKSFILKGNASKEECSNRIFNEYGLECGSLDEADAAACALIARCLAGFDEPNDERQRATLSKLVA